MLRLIRWRIRTWIARYRNIRFVWLPPLLIGPLFVLAVYACFGLFKVFLNTAPSFADATLLGAYAGVGLFQIIAGFRWGVTRLFLGSDLELLMVAPVRSRDLFGLKLFELVFASPVSIAVLVAITWGYGHARGLAIAPLLALVMPLVLAFIAALPGMLLALFLARFMIGPRLRTLIGVFSPFIGLIWALFFGSASTFYGRVTGRRFDPARFEQLGRSILRAVQRSPTSLPGDVVRAIAYGNWVVLGQRILFIAALAAALIALTYSVFFATFERSWGRLIEASTKKRTGRLVERLAPPVPRVARAIIVKEWRTFTRDLRLVQSLVFPILIVGFFAFRALRTPGQTPLANLWIAPFLLANQCASALLFEKRNIGLLKLAPVRGIDVITGKAIAYLAPAAIAVEALTIVIEVRTGLSLVVIAVSVVVMLWVLAGCMFAGLGIAACFAKFDVDQPRLGLGPVLLEMVVLTAFSASQGAVAYWLAGRIAHHNPLAGVVLITVAAGMAAVVVALTNAGARRLELIDAP